VSRLGLSDGLEPPLPEFSMGLRLFRHPASRLFMHQGLARLEVRRPAFQAATPAAAASPPAIT
jgi:hypothetical protein